LRALVGTHGTEKIHSLLTHRRRDAMGEIQQKDHIGPFIGLGEAKTYQSPYHQEHHPQTQPEEQATTPRRQTPRGASKPIEEERHQGH
jgi:hypothetical protein